MKKIPKVLRDQIEVDGILKILIIEENSIQKKFAIKIQEYILDCFQNMGWKTKDKNIRIKEMWAIINKKKDFNVIHTHPNCIFKFSILC